MGCFHSVSKSNSKREDHRKFNKSIHRKRKFFAGVEITKKSATMGAEGNFHFSYNIDKVENFTPVIEIKESIEENQDGE